MNRYALHIRIGGAAICAALLALFVSASGSAQEQMSAQEIDVVWTKSDGIRPEIFYTSYSAGTWSEPEMITDDYYDNMNPVIDRDSQGKRWVFWRAYDNQRTEIRYTTGTVGDWQKNQPLSARMQSNNAPSVVIDDADIVWVVWSAGDSGLDDIYYARHKDGAWSVPKLLHAPNDRPDVLPVIELDQNNRPLVSWKTLQDERYISVTSQYDGAEWSDPVASQSPEQESSDTAEDFVALPEFITNNGMVFVRIY